MQGSGTARVTTTAATLDVMSAMAADGNAGWVTLPADAYCNPEIHALEMERIFRAGWIAVGRVDEVSEPGSYLAREIVGTPVALVRDHKRHLRIFANICRHRWMKVLAGRGRKAVITCPYHAWTYGLDGRLRRAPGMECHPAFDADETRLEELSFEVWHGFVFVNLDGRAGPLAPRLAGLEDTVRAYDLDGWITARTLDLGEVPWDWKVMQDNGECYHHEGLHPETFQTVFPGERTGTTCGDDWILQWSPAREERLETLADGTRVMPGCYFEPLAGLDTFHRTHFVLVYVLPNYLIYLQPDCGIMIRFLPVAAGRSHMEVDLLVPESARRHSDFDARLDRFETFFHRFNDEDVPANTEIQKALESGRATPAPLSRHEEHNRHVAWWVASRLTRASCRQSGSPHSGK